MMTDFRANPPKSLAGSPVVRIKDFQTLELTDTVSGKVSKLEMPDTSNVLQFYTEDGSKVSVRPSGTEPKIKFYMEVNGQMKDRKDYDKANQLADAKVDQICKDLGI